MARPHRFEPDLAAWPAVGGRRERLQILRWLMHDLARPTPVVQALLAQAQQDPDWEVRVTAMLATARLGLRALAAPVARLALPTLQRQGVTAAEQQLLLALRDAALERLGQGRGRSLPPGVAQALAGDLAALPAELAMFVHALSVPLPDEFPLPTDERAVVWTDEGPQLADGHLLAWVPPVAHWLGDAALSGPALPNPVRRGQPPHGFFIDAEPRGRGTWAQARAAADGLAQGLGREVALPAPEQWEMAARGPDGRRFPWGANAEHSAWSDLSPWEMADIVSGEGEWLDAACDAATAAVAGGRASPVPARRWPARRDAMHAYRFAYACAG